MKYSQLLNKQSTFWNVEDCALIKCSTGQTSRQQIFYIVNKDTQGKKETVAFVVH